MRKFLVGKALIALIWATFFAAGFACSPAHAVTPPKGHAKFMESEDYKNAFERLAATMKEAKERLSPDEYKALERENAETMAASVREDMASGIPEADAWATACAMRGEFVAKALIWDWLRKNPTGVQGFYRLKSAVFDGYMTVQEGDAKNLYAVSIVVMQKKGAKNSGEVQGEGELKGKAMSLVYGNDDKDATVDVIFDGETAKASTSRSFKESGWLGANVVLDGEYIRERK